MKGAWLWGCLVVLACGRASAPGGVLSQEGGPDASTQELDAGNGTVDSPDAGPPPELKILRVLPPRGSSGGWTQVTLEGSGFLRGVADRASEATKATTLRFGSNPSLEFQVIDDGVIDARVPQGRAGLVNVTVENANGREVCTGCFTYYDDIVVSAVMPAEGSVRGGNDITLTGRGLTPDLQVVVGAFTSPRVTWVSATQLRVRIPEVATPQSVDIRLFNKNGQLTLRRAYRYEADLRIDNASPLFGPLSGGTSVTLSGQGFEGATAVLFGGVAGTALNATSDSTVTVTTPAGTTEGAVDMEVVTPRQRHRLRGGFSYVSAPSGFDIYSVVPHVGPASGGQVVRVLGAGLNAPGLVIQFGGVTAAVNAVSASEAQVVVPPRGTGLWTQDVFVLNGGVSRTLVGGYTYGMTLSSLTPTVGPLAGGTAAQTTGEGIPADVQLTLCGQPVVRGTVSATQVSFVTPPGAGGAACRLRAFSATDPQNEAFLDDAFSYEEPLSIGRLQPDRGALAGGTWHTVSGTGFGSGTTVMFGNVRGKDIKVIDSHTLTVRAPRGSSQGSVTVKVARGAQQDTLEGGFTYVDSRNTSGGLSGAPLAGTLNITVLDSTPGVRGQPVPLVQIILGADASTPFQGTTDARGQLTFSDSLLVTEQTMTASKEGYEAVTVSGINAENLTVFMSRTSGEGDPGSPPAGPPPSLISGRVLGFKMPRKLMANESLEARVFLAQVSLFGGAPFGSPYMGQNRWVLANEKETYVLTTQAGVRAAYAVMGIKNSQTGAFTPYLMGVRRNIATSADAPAEDQNIVLDMHLDMTVPVTVDGPLSTGGSPATNYLYAWMDLGREGFIPNPNNWSTGTSALSAVQSTSGSLEFPHFPQLDGASFVFMNMAITADGLSASHFFRRQPGDLRLGIRVGPMLPAPVIVVPSPSTRLTDTVRWSVDAGRVPDIHQVQIAKATQLGLVTLWSIVLPGDQTEVKLPLSVVERLRQEESQSTLYATLYSSRSPKFNYAQWSYDTLSGVSWSAYTIAQTVGFSP